MFQLEKQRKLNILERVVILRLDQITYYQEHSLPLDFAPVLIFKRENIQALKRRIQALEDEKKIQRKEKKDAKAKHIMLQRHKKVFHVSCKAQRVRHLPYKEKRRGIKVIRRGLCTAEDEVREGIEGARAAGYES